MLAVSIMVAMVTSVCKESSLTHLFVFPFLPLFPLFLLLHPHFLLLHILLPVPPAPLLLFLHLPHSSQVTTEKHWMSFPETVDEILDVSEDEGKLLTIIYSAVIVLCSDRWFL